MHYRHGLSVMRAQPFHIGHQSLIDKMRAECDDVTIVLGSTQESGTPRNPFSESVRVQMIQNVYSDNPRIHIIGLEDIHNAGKWGDYVVTQVIKTFPDLPAPDVYYAGSDYDAQWFKDSVKHIELLDRRRDNFPFVSASMVREMITFNDNRWRDFIPAVNHELVEKNFHITPKITYDLLVQNLRHFAAHNGFTDVTLGLSGGVDSAFVAVLAADALGGNHVHAIMMKTKYTSSESIDIARELAELNGLDYQETDIQPLVVSQMAFLNTHIQSPVKPVVEENVQARLRGQILMAYSNQFNWLVLACGNASESAMGYCTLYGDTCGGVSPIGAIYKSDLYKLAAEREAKSHAFPPLVLTRAPSAELAFNQKDGDSLPPYPVLDGILKAYLNNHQTSEQIIAAGADEATVNRVIHRYHQAAFKRAQMPPTLSATEETLYK